MTILTVAFFKEPIGWIDTKGPKGNWKSADTPLARFLENSHPGELPNTFKYLQAEGWLANVLNGKNDGGPYLEAGIRFLSNLTIIDENRSTALIMLGIDALHAKLKNCTSEDGTFIGTYSGPAATDFTPDFDKDLSELWSNSMMPKFSGAQVKVPVSLLYDQNGKHIVLPAVNTTFSHILKVPREGFLASLPAVEWMGLELARRAGLETAEHALIEMPNGMAPALIVERFDIPDVDDELRHLMRISDFCNITGREPEMHKYATDVAVCFDALEKQSSDPEADKIALFERIVLSHCLRDTDMHLKNISVLKTFDRETGEVNVRFAPTYDAMTTTIYPGLSDKESALNFNPDKESGGVSRDYKYADDLIAIAKLNGISADDAEKIVDRISQSVLDNALEIASNPPEILKKHPACLFALKCAATEIWMNSAAPNTPDSLPDGMMAFAYDYVEEAKPAAQAAPAPPKTAFNGVTPRFDM